MIKYVFLSLLCFSITNVFAEEESDEDDCESFECTNQFTEEELKWLETTYKRLDAEEAAGHKFYIDDGYDEDDED